ncbi:MAG: hypothetical protein Q8L60_13905, partial [Gammaproteobacteria bacterium]|nr:hypothetical protein [Gammaproteobacteria bacterium]
LELRYNTDGSNHYHRIPSSGTVNITGSNTWQPNWNGLLAGGNDLKVYVSASAPGSSTGTISKSGFAIHGENPTTAEVQSYAGSTPWFLHKLIMKESTYRQFLGGIGMPLVNLGGPAYGLMQINTSPTEAEKWNWQQNIVGGKSRLNGMNAEAVNFHNNQISQWTTYLLSNPPVAVPWPITYGSITYNHNPTGGQKPLSDGNWIKMYNGAPRHWLTWQDDGGPGASYWLVDDSANYVYGVSTAL